MTVEYEIRDEADNLYGAGYSTINSVTDIAAALLREGKSSVRIVRKMRCTHPTLSIRHEENHPDVWVCDNCERMHIPMMYWVITSDGRVYVAISDKELALEIAENIGGYVLDSNGKWLRNINGELT